MFPAPFYNPFVNENGNDKFIQQSKAVRSAQQHFLSVKRKSWWRQKFALLAGRCNRLKELSQLREHNSIVNIHLLGIQPVDINCIVGSENRADDFDDRFLPVKNHNSKRWIKIAELMLLNVTLPAVDLIKVNDIYYVRDGHHRISVAKHFGQKHIDANIMEMVIEPFDLKLKPAHPAMAMAICAQTCST
jgi:hypothetical protein